MARDISYRPEDPTTYTLPKEPYPGGVPSPSVLATPTSGAAYFNHRGHGLAALPPNKSARIVDAQHS